MTTLKIGDFVVERYGTSAEEFGVVIATHECEAGVISVRFPQGTFYTFASYCRLYTEWLNES